MDNGSVDHLRGSTRHNYVHKLSRHKSSEGIANENVSPQHALCKSSCEVAILICNAHMVSTSRAGSKDNNKDRIMPSINAGVGDGINHRTTLSVAKHICWELVYTSRETFEGLTKSKTC